MGATLGKRTIRTASLLGFGLLGGVHLLFTQTDTLQLHWQLRSSFSAQAKQMAVDPLDQIYLVDSLGAIEKRAENGDLLFRYTNNRLGSLGSIDVRDPFTILLYYPEYLTVLLLDRTLNPRAELSLPDAGYLDIGGVALSRDNRIWLYDRLTFKLKEIDAAGQALQESQDLSLLLPTPPHISGIAVFGNEVFLADTTGGVHVFNQFGQYQQTLPVETDEKMIASKNAVIFREQGHFFRFDRQAKEREIVPTPTQHPLIRQLAIQQDRLFLLLPGEVRIYERR